MSGGQGLQALFSGAQSPSGSASADPAPSTDMMQAMMAQFGSGMGNLQEIMNDMAQKSGVELSAFTGVRHRARKAG